MSNNYYQNNNYYKYGQSNNNFNTTLTQTSLKDFEVLSKLGEGSFSQVFKVKRKSDGLIYAMKKVKMGLLKEKEKENALNEVRILASLNDEYIVGYKEAFIDEQSQLLCVVMEFAAGGDLQGKINSHMKNKTMFPESEVWKALIHMSKGLQILHDMQILHRDLKCANIFLSQEGAYKLGDLNVSKVAKKGLVYTQTGTPYYASPEVWRDQPYDVKSDIWSLGCVLYEMCAQKPPFRANDMEGLYKKVQKGEFENIPKRYSDDLQRVLSSLLKVKPTERPSCEQILNNPIVQRNAEEILQNVQSNKKLVKKQSKGELLQTILLPKNLGQLKGKLPKANYKKAESIDDIEHDYEKDQEKAAFQQQLKQTNRIVSAGPRRADNYSNNLIVRNLPTPIQRQPLNDVKKTIISKEIHPLPQKYEINNIPPQIPTPNKSVKPRALGRPISGVVSSVTKNGAGIPPLSPIQGLAKVQPNRNRPPSAKNNVGIVSNKDQYLDNNKDLYKDIHRDQNRDYNRDYSNNNREYSNNRNSNQNDYYSNKVQSNQISDPYIDKYYSNQVQPVRKGNNDILSNNNPYKNVVDRYDIPSNNQNKYGGNNVAKNLTPQQYLINQQYSNNDLQKKYSHTPIISKNDDLNSKLANRERALLGGGGAVIQSQNGNPGLVNNGNQYIPRVYSEQSVQNYGKPQRIQSSKAYVGGGNKNYNYDIYQKDVSPQYGYQNINNNKNYNVNNNNYNINSNNMNNDGGKAYDPTNYMYARRLQSANIVAAAKNQVYGNQGGYQQQYQMPSQQANNIQGINKGGIGGSRPVWWG